MTRSATRTHPLPDPAKRQVRATWATGDYGAIARHEFWQTGERLVRRLDVRPGEDVLDVACGTGNAALRAATAGARVVGIDLTPELFATGRALAAEAGVEITWLEGDAEAMPVADESFDVVLSTFGCMFAPGHRAAAREIARVLRPGGRMGLCAWIPTGAMGPFFAILARYLPQPYPDAPAPLRWGTEEHVRDLFAGTGMVLQFERQSVPSSYDFASIEDGVAFYTSTFGPLIVARRLTEADGRWPDLRGELADFLAHQERERPNAEYLVTLGRRPSEA